MKRRAKLEICHNTRGKQRWWYRVKGGNGEIMVVSEKYGSHADAVRRADRFVAALIEGLDFSDYCKE
jgi:uncharacterized protein YegP (UPF0339 family)